MIGAGIGSLAAYGRPGQDWTFYELDPTVVYLAKDSGRFAFWKDSAANVRYVIGDGRLSLAKEASEPYDLIILDAFSSDAVPTHLLTREALQLYRRKLTKNEIVAFHISTRFQRLGAIGIPQRRRFVDGSIFEPSERVPVVRRLEPASASARLRAWCV